ncbi:glycosyltransferase [Latilactobacillus sakei]|uniref:glycosyltransferase n=1 Tax=Latilactobacillus sakei TaxID=1599 RepID=UPI003F538844
MKVLHIAEANGGVEKYLEMLLKNTTDYRNVLICSNLFSEIQNEKQYNLDFSRTSSPIKNIKIIRKIRSIIKIENPDIVFCHSTFAGIWGRIALIGLRKKVVYNPHGWAFDMDTSNIKKSIFAMIERIFSIVTDRYMMISEYEYQSAKRHHITNANKLSVVMNAVDEGALLADANVSLNSDVIETLEDKFIIGMVGRIDLQKGPDIFIKMAKIVKEDIPNAYFVIVGDGKMKNEIKKLADENNLSDSLLITGWVNNTAMYIKQFDISILLSRWEGFGLVLAEYMFLNKPIISTNVGAITNLINDSKSGILIESEDYESAARVVRKLYTNQEQRQQLANNGLKYANENLTVEKFINNYRDFIEEL